MSDFREFNPEDDRDAWSDEDDEQVDAPATLDPAESVEDEVDDRAAEERESAIEAGEIEP